MLQFIQRYASGYISLFGWIVLWSIGGMLIIRGAFKLKKEIYLISGFAVGLLVESWMANILGRFLDPLLAFWFAAALTFLLGFVFCIPLFKEKQKISDIFPIIPWQWITFFLLFYVFFMISRGMSIWDEFKTLPLTSMIATGDIPPHFPYDSSIVLDEHYLRYLIAAQFMRVGDMYPWTALSILKALGLGLTSILVILWVKSITKNMLAGVAGGILHIFGGGTRWLLLLLPPGIVDKIGQVITRIGSGLSSGATLREALISSWAAQGMATIPIPFAFTNGFLKPAILGIGWDNITLLIILLFLLIFDKAEKPKAFIVVGLLLAGLGLMEEMVLAFLSLAIFIFALIYIFSKHKEKIKKGKAYLILLLFVWILVFFQGGFYTSLLNNIIRPDYVSYHDFNVHFSIFPQFINPHLGKLSLFNPAHLLTIILESGPILLVFPLVLIWGFKAYKKNDLSQAAYIATSIFGLIFLFVQIISKGIDSAVNRVQNDFLEVSLLFAVPILFFWLKDKKHKTKIFALVLFLICITGGFVVFGTELSAIQEPVLSLFITEMDVRMMDKYWNTFDEDVRILDPDIPRAITIFGRTSNSSIDFYKPKDEWQLMIYDPAPYNFREAGYDYFYYDRAYWKTLSAKEQELITDSCVIEINRETEWTGDFRALIDISNCE